MRNLGILVFLFGFLGQAQSNILLDRDFWKSQPSLEEVKLKIQEGHDASEMNQWAFDPPIYAMLEDAPHETVKFLLEQDGNEIEKITHDRRTYIFWAAYADDIETMKYLLEQGANLDLVDSHDYSPATFAAATGNLNPEVYQLFAEHGVVLENERYTNGANLLLLASPYAEQIADLDFFVERGISLKAKDNHGNNLFNYAAKGGNIEFLKQLREEGYQPVDTESGNAFHFAAKGLRGKTNGIETYRYLVDLNLDVTVTDETGRTPLHLIARNNPDGSIVDLFLEHGADLDATDEKGHTPLHYAARGNELEVVKKLTTPQTLNASNKAGETPLFMAVRHNSPEIVEYLIDAGADVKATASGNTLVTPLIASYSSSGMEVFKKKLKQLKRARLDINTMQEGGDYGLHLAVVHDDLKLIKLLPNHLGVLNAKNREGYTPLHIAAMQNSHPEILAYLVREGADVSITTEFGETAYDLAMENEKLQAGNHNLSYLE